MARYKKYPPDPPTHREIWALIVLIAAALLANLAHQGGLW